MDYKNLLAPLALTLGLSTSQPDFVYAMEGKKPDHSTYESKAGKKPKPKSGNPLKGSGSSQIKQNEVADTEGLTRIKDDEMLEKFIRSGYLVRLRNDARGYYIDDELNERYAYARPWTSAWLNNLSSEYVSRFGSQIKVTSVVRPESYQEQLRKENKNAARVHGPKASSHSTGSTIDMSTRDMSMAEKKWMREKLKAYERDGYVEATEEKGQPTFHVMVFKTQHRGNARAKKK